MVEHREQFFMPTAERGLEIRFSNYFFFFIGVDRL